LLLCSALGLPVPGFAHVGLLLDARGVKLAKRHGSLSLRELEHAGVRPQRVLGLLAHTLGWLPTPREVAADELLAQLGEARGLAWAARPSTRETPPTAAVAWPSAPAAARALSEGELA